MTKAIAEGEEHFVLTQKFRLATKEIIKKYKIEGKFIIDLDETLFIWEYLPKKIVYHKLSKTCRAWK